MPTRSTRRPCAVHHLATAAADACPDRQAGPDLRQPECRSAAVHRGKAVPRRAQPLPPGVHPGRHRRLVRHDRRPGRRAQLPEVGHCQPRHAPLDVPVRRHAERRRQLHGLGIPVTQARTAAFRQLVFQAPPPVVARSLGFGYGTATGHAIAAGGTWNRYPVARRDSPSVPPNPGRNALTSYLTAAFRAAADGLHADKAAIELIISHGVFLHRDDFTRYIGTTPSISEGTPLALIEWDAALIALDCGGLPVSGERRILRITASLAIGHPVSLRDAVPGLDHHNLRLVTRAMQHAASGPGFRGKKSSDTP